MSKEYLKWHKKSGIKIGDKVKLLRMPKDYELGWEMIWTESETDEYIGQTFKVLGDCRAEGFLLDTLPFYFRFPYFVLEVVEPKEKEEEIEVYKVVQKSMGGLMSCRACIFSQGIEYKIGEYVSATPENIKANNLLAAFTSYNDAVKFIKDTGVGEDLIFKALAKGVSDILPVWHVPKGTIMCREIKLVEEVKEKRTYDSGDTFRDEDGGEWILSQCEKEEEAGFYIQLVCYKGKDRGIRRNFPIKVRKNHYITQEEFSKICEGDEDDFELIEKDE